MWKRTKTLALILLSAAALALLAFALLRPASEPEPQYKGRPLSYWLSLYPPADAEKRAAADEAVTQIGTNALPFLLNWIRYERPAWRTRAARALSRMPDPLQRLTWPWVISRSETLAGSSGSGFQTLGTNAVGAIPELTRLMRNTNATQTARRAIQALTCIGTNSLPSLLSAAEDSRLPVRYYAVYVLGYQMPTTNAGLNEAVGSMLLRCLSATNDPDTVQMAAYGIGLRQYAPEVSVPALLACLANAGTNSSLREGAVVGLGRYGAPAAAALPALTNALSDASADVRSAASNAIQQITSAALTNAQPP